MKYFRVQLTRFEHSVEFVIAGKMIRSIAKINQNLRLQKDIELIEIADYVMI